MILSTQDKAKALERVGFSVKSNKEKDIKKARTSNGESAKATQAEILLSLLDKKGLELLQNETREPFALMPVDEHTEIWPIESKTFRVWLCGAFYEKTKKAIGSDALRQVIDTLSAKALFQGGKPIKLYTRVAWDHDAIWYDLSRPDWKCARITPTKWEIVNSPLIFRRYNHQEEQCVPVSGGDALKILEYVPVKRHDFLFICWLISALIPGYPVPMPVFYGEKGAGKSTACEFVKSLIDPSALKTLTLQSDPRSFAVNLQSHWFLPFDNCAYISDETSDAMCRAITGGGIQQRKLFTDADDVIFSFQRVLALNGISVMASRADLLDRSLLIELSRIKETDRRELSSLRESFSIDKPVILGGMLDILSKAMAIYPTVKLKELPRMADFCRWGYAIGDAMAPGCGGVQFFKEYRENLFFQNEEAISSDPVATLIVEMTRSRPGEWVGTPTSLFKELEAMAFANGINTRSKGFPKDPTRLSKRLNSIRSNLENVGIVVEMSRSGARAISIYKKELPSIASIPSKTAV